MFKESWISVAFSTFFLSLALSIQWPGRVLDKDGYSHKKVNYNFSFQNALNSWYNHVYLTTRHYESQLFKQNKLLKIIAYSFGHLQEIWPTSIVPPVGIEPDDSRILPLKRKRTIHSTCPYRHFMIVSQMSMEDCILFTFLLTFDKSIKKSTCEVW